MIELIVLSERFTVQPIRCLNSSMRPSNDYHRSLNEVSDDRALAAFLEETRRFFKGERGDL